MISVIVPVYNVCDYLKEAIDSVLNQTYKNLEIILVDDGSIDGSEDIIEEYSKKDDRIKCIHQKNQGLSAARNVGLENAHGEYVFFFDSDDYLHSQIFDILINVLNETNSDIVIASHCKGEVVNSKWKEKSYFGMNFEVRDGKYWITENVLYSNEYTSVDMCCAWGKLYKRKMFDSTLFPIGKLREDEFTTYKLFYMSQKIAYYGQPLYFYRQRDGSIMNKKSDKNYRDCYEALIDRIKYFECLDTEMCDISKFKCVIYLFEVLRELYDQKGTREKLYQLFSTQYKKSFISYYRNIKKYFSKKQFIKYWIVYFSGIGRFFIFRIIMNGKR